MEKAKLAEQRAGSSTEQKKPRKQTTRKPPPKLDDFWPTAVSDVEKIKQVDVKNQSLPLARIKKIMKLDENAKMIAAEAPLLFAKACEYFIQELTLRAWVHTEENKRRTLQRSDIATAISIYDQFDFLIDIVPREDIKPLPQSVKKETDTKMQSSVVTTSTPNTSSDQIQYVFQLSQQQSQQQQQQQQTQTHQQPLLQQQQQNPNSFQQTTSSGIVNQSIAAMNTTTAGMSILTPQNLIQPVQQPIQLIQQIVTPTGDIQNVPITISQNQLLRMQMQGVTGNNLQGQQLMIPTLQTQQQPHLLQIGSTGTIATTATGLNTNQNSTASTGMFINASHGNSIVSTDKNLGSTFRPN